MRYVLDPDATILPALRGSLRLVLLHLLRNVLQADGGRAID